MDLTFETAFTPQAFVLHGAYLLLILSMLMTRMTVLRILALISGLAALVYFVFFARNAVFAVWTVAFVTANGWALARLVLRDRSITFTEDEQEFRQHVIPLYVRPTHRAQRPEARGEPGVEDVGVLGEAGGFEFLD